MDYMGAVIWQKQTTMNTTGGGAVMGSFPYPRNGILKIDYEFILIFKKQGKAPVPAIEQKQCSEMTKDEWNTFLLPIGISVGLNKTDTLRYFLKNCRTV